MAAGEYLFRRGESSTHLVLILDGTFDVRLGDEVIGTVGPGTVVGERAGLEVGLRTADMYATTDARVALVPCEGIDPELLSDLALGHGR
jgi:CRP-like cAMP-binding protein